MGEPETVRGPNRSGTETDAELSPAEQRGMLLSLIDDFAELPLEALLCYLGHVGFDLQALRAPEDFPEAWCGFYRLKTGAYDVERAFQDLAHWPPVAAKIAVAETPKPEGLPHDL